jgi:hypothetical protein
MSELSFLTNCVCIIFPDFLSLLSFCSEVGFVCSEFGFVCGGTVRVEK